MGVSDVIDSFFQKAGGLFDEYGEWIIYGFILLVVYVFYVWIFR